ncbi:MAG TPA: hypothetical protein VGR91_17830 [Stellaceae bacterium]|nr:hypothetical protein [Stellaceae bacterium]
MKRATVFGMGIVLILMPFSVGAGTPSEILRAFGLVGTWSPDCTKEISKGGQRVTYIVGDVGEPTMVETYGAIIGSKSIIIQLRLAIQEAARTKDEKIKLIDLLIAAKVNGIKQQSKDPDFVQNVVTISKKGSKIRTIDSRKIDNSAVFVEDGIEFKMIPKDIHRPIVDWHNQQWVKGIIETPPMQKCPS